MQATLLGEMGTWLPAYKTWLLHIKRGFLHIKGLKSITIYLVESFSFINFVPDNYTPKQ